jgi:hypothetical protein
MKRMARQIGVTQVVPPVPNPVAPECICVPKVYDWVVMTENIKTTVPVPTPTPAGCPSIVTEITCSLGSKSFFPITCAEDESCTVLARRPANIDGIHAHIVKLRQEIPISVTFTGTDATGTPASCTVPLSVSFIHQVILCFPDEFTDENLVCRLISGDCTITTPPPTEGVPVPTSVGVELLLCIEIQVLAAVKLEVLAKFCAPRPSIPVTALNVCPSLLFPEQCDFLPQPNCPCQGAAEDSCIINGVDCLVEMNGTLATGGEQTLIARICDGCALINSRVIYNFSSRDPDVESFTFFANSVNLPGCTFLDGRLLIVHLSGTGTVITETTMYSNVFFTLLVAEQPSPFQDGWLLSLSGPFTAMAAHLSEESENVSIRFCDRFPSL